MLVACRGELVSRTQPLPLVTAQFQTGFAEPQPEEAVLTLWLRRATSVLNQKSIEEFAMWGGTPWSAGRRPRRPLFRVIAKPDQGGPARTRPPHRELYGELLTQGSRSLFEKL